MCCAGLSCRAICLPLCCRTGDTRGLLQHTGPTKASDLSGGDQWHTVCMSSYSEYILPYLQRPRISNWGMAMNGHCAGARSYGKSSQRRTGKIGQHLRLPLSLRAHMERHVLVAAERQTRSAFKGVMVAERNSMVRDCDPEARVPSTSSQL